MDSGARYATGKKGSYSPVESFLYTRPEAYYAAAALGVLLVCLGLFFGLRRWRASEPASVIGLCAPANNYKSLAR